MSLLAAAKAKGLDAQFSLAGVGASYEVDGYFKSPGITAIIKESSGTTEDGSVRSDYFEIRLRRSEISDPQVGALIRVDVLTVYRTTSILYMDNDVALFSALKI